MNGGWANSNGQNMKLDDDGRIFLKLAICQYQSNSVAIKSKRLLLLGLRECELAIAFFWL